MRLLRALVLGLTLALGATTSPQARAQCPSNASSCAVCHEGGEAPPSEDGTPWHADHAFADLCVGCHQGDRDRMDPTAHRGMVDPLVDPTVTCVACHSDGLERVLAYTEREAPQETASVPSPPPPTAPPPAAGIGGADSALFVVAVGLGLALLLGAVQVWPTPARVWQALRSPTWSPAVAGAGLGVVVAVSEALCGRPIAVSGGVDRLAAFAGAALFPTSSYWRFVVPPAITWQVWLLVGLLAGAAASAALSGTSRWRWLPDSGWTEAHGPGKGTRLALAFAGAVLVQIGAGIAGGCTSGLAISGGALLAPGAFLFVAGMFGGGIPTAWLWSRRAP